MIDFELALAHENQFQEFSKETDQFIKWVGDAFCTTSITPRLARLMGGGGREKRGKQARRIKCGETPRYAHQN